MRYIIWKIVGMNVRFVFLLKCLLIIVIITLISAIIVPVVTSDKKENALTVDNGMDKPDNINKMINPNFKGITDRGLPFIVKALTAEQIDEDNIKILDISGEIILEGNTKVYFKADNGEINIKNNDMILNDNVSIVSDSGYKIFTRKVFVNMKKEKIYGDELVSGSSPMGKINAKGFLYYIPDETLKFNDDIKVDVDRLE